MSERAYLQLLAEVLNTGAKRPDRTGTGTRSVFGRQLRFNLADGFPLLTTKHVHFHSVVVELLWMLGGHTDVRWLQERGVTIWDEWADEHGQLGPIYGEQWRHWGEPEIAEGIDQIRDLIEGLRAEPYSRRHIVTAWNPNDLEYMALSPCCALFQFYVADGRLSCQVYQRSADVFLGLPFNIASYALLTHLVAQTVKLEPGELVHTLGDVHLYDNHVEQAREQLARTWRGPPSLVLKPWTTVFNAQVDDIAIECYDHYPAIPAPVAI